MLFFLALSHFVVFISTKAFHNGILFIFLWTSGQVAFVLSEIYQTQLEIELLFRNFTGSIGRLSSF